MISIYHLLTKSFHLHILTKTLPSEQQIDLLLYGNLYCLLGYLHNFCRNNGNYKHLCRRFSNTYGDQTKLEGHKLRCIQQEGCNISYMHPNQNK